jgi:predicted lipid carrier protein YhbT
MSTPRAGSSKGADDPVTRFFAALAEPGHLATFAGESATLRFDIGDGKDIERWHVTVNKGDVTVTRQNRSADAVVRIQRPRFEAIVTGRLNAQAALLRGLLTCEGSVSALMMFQRCLPGPSGSTGWAAPISADTVMAQRRAI